MPNTGLAGEYPMNSILLAVFKECSSSISSSVKRQNLSAAESISTKAKRNKKIRAAKKKALKR